MQILICFFVKCKTLLLMKNFSEIFCNNFEISRKCWKTLENWKILKNFWWKCTVGIMIFAVFFKKQPLFEKKVMIPTVYLHQNFTKAVDFWCKTVKIMIPTLQCIKNFQRFPAFSKNIKKFAKCKRKETFYILKKKIKIFKNYVICAWPLHAKSLEGFYFST